MDSVMTSERQRLTKITNEITTDLDNERNSR
jgi:hypothetical protein